MMLRGRHRGLPYALDRAITLPSDLVTSDEGEEGKGGYRDEDTDMTTTAGSEGGREKEKRRLGMQGRKMMKAVTQ
jgi:hypothetical protein